jgi:hypothetical protein
MAFGKSLAEMLRPGVLRETKAQDAQLQKDILRDLQTDMARNMGLAAQNQPMSVSQSAALHQSMMQTKAAVLGQAYGGTYDPLAGMSAEEKDEVRKELVSILAGMNTFHGDPDYDERRRAALPGAVAAVKMRREKQARAERSPNNRPAYQISLTALKDAWRTKFGDQWVDIGTGTLLPFVTGDIEDPAFWADAYFRLEHNGLFEKTPDGWARLGDN